MNLKIPHGRQQTRNAIQAHTFETLDTALSVLSISYIYNIPIHTIGTDDRYDLIAGTRRQIQLRLLVLEHLFRYKSVCVCGPSEDT